MSAVAEHESARPRWPGDGKDFRVTMGLHPCAPQDWLWRGVGAQELIAAKERTLREHYDQAVAITPDGDAAAREAADLMWEHLLAASAEATGPLQMAAERNLADDQHPLEAVTRLIAEDVCIMTPSPSASPSQPTKEAGEVSDEAGHASYALTAAVLCAPSRWSLREKLGLDVTAIHEPVPGYEAIAAPTARFFERLRVDDIVERTNWTVLDSPELFQPDRAHATLAFIVAAAADAPVRLDLFWLRLERQTLRKLAQTSAVVFTILTTTTRLDELAATEPEVARQLAHKMRTAPAATCDYKGWENSAANIAAALEAACSAA